MSSHETSIYPEVFDTLEFRFEGEALPEPEAPPLSPVGGYYISAFETDDPYDPDGQDFVFERPIYQEQRTFPDAAVVLKEKIKETVLENKQYWDPVREIVTNIAGAGMKVVRSLKDDIMMMQAAHQKPVFGMQFTSRNLPFEYSTDPKTLSVVITAITGPLEDQRLRKGIAILGINQTILNVGPTSDSEFEELVERVELPFTLVFEDESVEDFTDAVDDEHHGGVLKGSLPSRSDRPHPSSNNPGQSSASYTSFLNTGLSKVSMFSNLVQKTWNGPSDGADAPVSAPIKDSSRKASASPSQEEDSLYFPVKLTGRSPPFVYDLHADGMSIVVAKLVGKGSTPSNTPLLQEGCVIRFLNGKEVLCTSRQDFDAMLTSAELPIVLELERAPALYRHQDALQLFTAGTQEKHLHVFTVIPVEIIPPETREQRHNAGNSSILDISSYAGPAVQYEDSLETAGRAMSVLQSFRAQGVAVEMKSIETVAVGDGGKRVSLSDLLGGAGGSSKGVSTGVYSSVQPTSGLLRGMRVWFYFSEAMNATVEIPNPSVGDALVAALEICRSGKDGSWIVLKCISASSAWVHEGGMILGRPYMLTHVNGYDVSAAGYRSVEPRIRRGDGSWEGSVLPLFKKSSRIRLTIA